MIGVASPVPALACHSEAISFYPRCKLKRLSKLYPQICSFTIQEDTSSARAPKSVPRFAAGVAPQLTAYNQPASCTIMNLSHPAVFEDRMLVLVPFSSTVHGPGGMPPSLLRSRLNPDSWRSGILAPAASPFSQGGEWGCSAMIVCAV